MTLAQKKNFRAAIMEMISDSKKLGLDKDFDIASGIITGLREMEVFGDIKISIPKNSALRQESV